MDKVDVRILPPQALDWQQFIGCRVSFYSTSDNTRCSGWLLEASEDKVIVRSSSLSEVPSGASYLFHVFGAKHDIMFVARSAGHQAATSALAGIAAEDITFVAATSIRRVPISRNARKMISGLAATAEFDGGSLDVKVEDASLTGIGLLSPTPIEPPRTMDLRISTPDGEVHLLARVVHCHQVREDRQDLWRIGSSIEAKDRVSSALWAKITR